jgi:hypothetical protein
VPLSVVESAAAESLSLSAAVSLDPASEALLLASPRRSRMAAMSSLLRIPEAPLTPASLASARSSGSTIEDSEPEALADGASVAGPASVVGAGSVAGVESAAGAPIGTSATAGDENSEVTLLGSSTESELLPAVTRSVSVNGFPFLPPLNTSSEGFFALSQLADCEAATADFATVMAGIRGDKANRHPREELVFVLVSAQEKPMRLLDESEDSPLPGRKQETH